VGEYLGQSPNQRAGASSKMDTAPARPKTDDVLDNDAATQIRALGSPVRFDGLEGPLAIFARYLTTQRAYPVTGSASKKPAPPSRWQSLQLSEVCRWQVGGIIQSQRSPDRVGSMNLRSFVYRQVSSKRQGKVSAVLLLIFAPIARTGSECDGRPIPVSRVWRAYGPGQ